MDVSQLPASVAIDSGEGIWPRISIVTPSYNQAQFLEETICSILDQGYPNLEYIVIDGGSTDNSVDIIRKYEKHIDFWVSESDRGQSHAINKGIQRCTGDIFNWINSDDLLMPGALRAVAEAWRESPGNIVSGNAEFFNESGVFRCEKAQAQTLRNFVRFWEAKDFAWAQPATFIPLADLKALGGVREDLRYCMDYNMMVRLLQRGLAVKHIDEPLTRFRVHPDSKTMGETEEFRLERVPMLRGMTDLHVDVSNREWNRQQARRLVDVGKHALCRGAIISGIRLLGRAFLTSPVGTLREVCGRVAARAFRSGKDA